MTIHQKLIFRLFNKRKKLLVFINYFIPIAFLFFGGMELMYFVPYGFVICPLLIATMFYIFAYKSPVLGRDDDHQLPWMVVGLAMIALFIPIILMFFDGNINGGIINWPKIE